MKPKKQPKPTFNESVEAAYRIVEQTARKHLCTIERDELRCIFERSAQQPSDTIIHELISPLLYMRLEREDNELLSIRFGIEPVKNNHELAAIPLQFLRLLFKITDKENTVVLIEHCIKVDWFINCCTDMFDYVYTQPKHHDLTQLPYKPASARKRTLRVA